MVGSRRKSPARPVRGVCRQKGTILRDAYTAHRHGKAIKVPASCIKSVSQSGQERHLVDEKILANKKKMHTAMEREFGKPKCNPKTQVERAGYVRKGYRRSAYSRKSGSRVSGAKVPQTRVAPVCITKRGKVGSYKIPVVLNKGSLKKYGYEDVQEKTIQERHEALANANKHIKNPLSIYRKLVILSTMFRNKNPPVAQLFHSDAEWVKRNFGLKTAQSRSQKSRTKSRKSKSRRSRK